MATRMIPHDDDNLRTVRIDTTDLPLSGRTEHFSPVREVNVGMDDMPTVVVRRSEAPEPEDPGDKTVLVRRPAPAPAAPAPVAAPVAEPQGDSPESWCVGWLVAVSGPMKGRAFQLRLGMNHIGRGAGNTICLAEDNGISRDAQAVVTYDRRRNQFFASPGMNCSQTSELNGGLLLAPSALSSGDTLQLSDDTTLRFVAFCDAQFHWDY